MNTEQDMKAQSEYREGGREQFHLSEYIDILNRRKLVVICSFLLIFSLVAGYSFLSDSVYEGKAELFIEASSSPFSEVAQVGIQARQVNEYYFNVVNHLLASRTVLEEVVKRARVEFPDLLKSGRGKSVLLTVKESIFSHVKPDNNQELSEEEILANEINRYGKNLRIRPESEFGVLTISVYDQNPELAAGLANLHAKVFINSILAKKKSELLAQFNWLADQVEEQKSVVTQSYLNLYNYQKEHGLVLANRTGDLTRSKLQFLGTGYIEAKSDRIFRESIYNELKKISVKDEHLFAIPLIAGDETITSLRNQQLKLSEQRAELAVIYGKKHSKMVEIRKRLNHISGEIEKEFKRIVQLSREQLEQAISKEETALEAVEEQKKEAIGIQEKTFQHEILEREAASNQDLYQSLLAQWKQVNMVSMFESENLHLTQPALVPKKPVKPRIMLNLVLGAVLSLLFGVGLAIFIDYMDQKVRTSEDVVRHLNLQVLGSVPYEKNHEEHDLLTFVETQRGRQIQDPYTYGYMQALDWLPQEIQEGRQDGLGKLIQVVSCATGEGKSTILGKIAVRLGKAGFRVLAVDCDFQRPALHTLFSEERSEGLSDIMLAITSMSLTEGELSKYSVSDLYEIIQIQKLSGKLATLHNKNLMISTFNHGKILSVESSGDSAGDKIGSMLHKGGYLTEKQLTEALERNKRTGQPLGYVLLNSGYISQDILQGHLRLQTEENIQKLFSWKKGKYSFSTKAAVPVLDEKVNFVENYDQFISQLREKTENTLFVRQIDEIIKDTAHWNLQYISAGKSLPQPGDPVNFALLGKLLTHTKSDYDIVLIDGPPILEAPDAITIMHLTDGCVFVIKSGALTHNSIKIALGKISVTGKKIIATVVNQVRG